MKNVLFRNLSEEQSKLITDIMELTGEGTATKAILKVLADYQTIKADIEEYKLKEVAVYRGYFCKIKRQVEQLANISEAVNCCVSWCDRDLQYLNVNKKR